MRHFLPRLAAFLAVWVFAIPVAQAHSFGRTFTLPMPFEMYAWASAATLGVTFLIMLLKGHSFDVRTQDKGYFVDPDPRKNLPALLLRILGLAGLILAVYSGFEGTQRRPDNFNMTWFWVIWMLLLLYLCGLFGNWYQAFNPFRTAIDVFMGVWKTLRLPTRTPLADGLSDVHLHVFSLLGLVALSAYELFGQSRPFDLSVFLLAYLGWCALGCLLAGRQRFFNEGDFFSVYFELISRTSSNLKGLFGRAPKPNLITPFASLPLVALIVTLFSTTALDGIKDTEWWVRTVWPQFGQMFASWVSEKPDLLLQNPLMMQMQLGSWFRVFEKFCLILGPLILAGLLAGMLWLSRAISGQKVSLARLACAFAPSLIPIILVYSFSHYFTLILTQGVQIVHLVSDPLGQGMNLIGTRNLLRAPILLDAQWIWNIQLGSILGGHILGAVAAHDAAFRVFNSARAANLSQIPVLSLMIGLTVLGLWILSQPVRML